MERIRVAANEIPSLASRIIALALDEAIRERSTASLCLAGGTTPRATYMTLAGTAGVDWSRVSVFFGDERCVPPEHSESNYRLAREALLDRVAPGSIHRMRGEAPDRSQAAAEYASELPDLFDVLILGIGEDCHTASLFPGSDAIHERDRLVLPVVGPKAPFERLTLTPPALERSRLILVLAAGASKADAVHHALQGARDVAQYPAQLVRDAVWLMDHDAAQKLSGSLHS